ncbi:MAG: DUF885 domain-containing protein [Actinomadura sp.]
MTQDVNRPATPVDDLVDDFLDQHAALDPILATARGLLGHDTEMPDLSPDGLAEISALRRRTLDALDTVTPADATDRVTIAAAREQFEVAELLRATGAEEASLNTIESPVQRIREVFDLMATATSDDWASVATRLARVPAAVSGYITSLRLAASRGQISPHRQVAAGIEQSLKNTGADGFFATFASSATADLPRSVRSDLDRGAMAAAAAYQGLATFLRDELLPNAPERDAAGRDRYALWSRSFLGTSVDLAETYAWGQEELARVAEEMRATAERIAPGASVRAAMDHLDTDPSRILVGTDALRAWMQDTSDAAVAELADTHFDIPAPVRRLECLIAPTPTGGIYYTGPSEDFSRPGRMWWTVPPGVDTFATWRERTTVYHEGVPGHHLQVAQTAYRRQSLNRWRRAGSWVSGHGEGWALYAERLMADLGFLDDPGDHLGMLDAQSLRAVRVVIDVGFHCGFPAPAEVGGGAWTYEKAWRLLTTYSSQAEPRLRYELERYLGWPGQAPSYKIGERSWLRLRDEARAQDGAAFDPKAFHRRALDLGSVGLDALRTAVLGGFDD